MKRFDITNTTEINVKRLYLPLKIQVKCPKCNSINEHDFSVHYLEYPSVNQEEAIGVYCEICDDHIDVNMTLKIAVEVNQE